MNYKQQSNQGCLIVDLLYLFGIEPAREKEEAILSDGLFNVRDNFTLGCLHAFLDRYPDKAMTLYIDNKFYLEDIKQLVRYPQIKLVHKKNDKKFMDSLDAPFIFCIDNHIIDGWTHLPHYMMVTGSTEKFYKVFDPWKGGVQKYSKDKLISSIDSLRDRVGFCPIIIAAG